MAVFRIERTRDYTVMSNHHLRNANLSLNVERHIKYTKKIKLNAKRNIVKFNSIQFI